MSQNMQRQCQCCKKQGQDLMRCSRCKNVFYCSVECQKKDWPAHKLNCKKAPTQPTEPKTQPQKENMGGIDEFYDIKHIGTGNFTSIFKAISKKDQQVYAIKQADKAKVQRLRKTADLFMQKHCLSKLKDCPNVVRLYRTFQDQIHLFLQMQFPERGQLWEQAKHFGIISQKLFKYYAYHTLRSVYTLHEQYDIVHRDLKPENILLNDKYQIKLIDFGTARDLSRPDIKGSGNGLKGRTPFEHYVGTPHYMAPECIHNRASQKISDVYSLSGLLYFLKVGSPPFAGGSQYLIFQKSLQSQLLLCPQLFSPLSRDLISKMNKKQMSQRLPLGQALAHQYFADIDKQKPPTYQQIFASLSPYQKYVMDLCSNLCQRYGLVYNDQSVAARQDVYKYKIVPQLQMAIDEADEQWRGQLIQRIQIIKLQTQVMINYKEDTNIGFSQLYRELHNITQPEVVDPYQIEQIKEAKVIQHKAREIAVNQ